MREIKIGTQRYTKVVCLDEPGAGGACHLYEVQEVIPGSKPEAFLVGSTVIRFQNGPIKEAGVNGCHNEDLIAIVIDRLQHFQAGEYSCLENKVALVKLEEALRWLGNRTKDRQARGVEGKSEV